LRRSRGASSRRGTGSLTGAPSTSTTRGSWPPGSRASSRVSTTPGTHGSYLRNVGYFGLAIIDRHILSNMVEHGLITEEESRKGVTKRRYHTYEGVLEKVASRLDMEPGELDLYLWYRKTGKVLK